MSNKSPTKYLKLDKWYHATTLDGWKSICRYGILANHNIGHELDFGHGFYLTHDKKQAEKYIITLLKYKNKGLLSEIEFLLDSKVDKSKSIPVLVEFDISPLEWLQRKEYDHYFFNKYDEEFAEFVFHNRMYNVNGEDHHGYDFIFGVMSDSNPIIDIERFRNGELEKVEVLEGFKKSTSSKQLSVHSQQLCDIIKPSRAYRIDTGEELNVDDYFNKREPKFTDESAS
ncbi:DUF3990 domain-containing protein [Paenibacillus illinoisensis]|uniref:DUF3990 domain-containing protein n=1 Tax=Paenibacillus illinoisensis TaxID=59845 RepID=A0A2W0CJ92_9BACL|nr:DUF3990 domain-containing protein [Paenibacillus illinoisensis]PYY28375.1 hypothetical protein PIL02S_03531 [Paenibacillus illinoisensis]